jgi:hypothetical protein
MTAPLSECGADSPESAPLPLPQGRNARIHFIVAPKKGGKTTFIQKWLHSVKGQYNKVYCCAREEEAFHYERCCPNTEVITTSSDIYSSRHAINAVLNRLPPRVVGQRELLVIDGDTMMFMDVFARILENGLDVICTSTYLSAQFSDSMLERSMLIFPQVEDQKSLERTMRVMDLRLSSEYEMPNWNRSNYYFVDVQQKTYGLKAAPSNVLQLTNEEKKERMQALTESTYLILCLSNIVLSYLSRSECCSTCYERFTLDDVLFRRTKSEQPALNPTIVPIASSPK